jgi:cytochrome P450
MEISDRAVVRALLEDPGARVPEAPPAAATSGIAWLRASVSRFGNGETHRRRRALACAELEAIDVDALREATRTGTAPLDALAAALGVSTPIAPQVAVVAGAYHPHMPAGPAAEVAVATLVAAFGGIADERTAVRISLLVQACDATAALVERALARPGEAPAGDALLAVLRDDPPVRVTRRVVAGEVAVLDLAAAQLPFGSGPRRCPGREHALALAAGAVESARAP